MGDEEHGDFAFEGVDGAGELGGGVVVEGTGGFVEDEHFGALEQGFYGAVDFGHLAGLHHLLKAGVGVDQRKEVAPPLTPSGDCKIVFDGLL